MTNQGISKKQYRPSLIILLFTTPPIVIWVGFLIQSWRLDTISAAVIKGVLYFSVLLAVILVDYLLTRTEIQKAARHGILASILWGPFVATYWSALGYSWSQVAGTVAALFIFGIVYLLGRRLDI